MKKRHEYTDEELENLALSVSTDDETIIPAKMSDVRKFIYETGLKPGPAKVLAAQIYEKYLEWKGDKKPRNKIWFFREFAKVFDRGTDNYERYYYLDPQPFDLSDKEYWRIKSILRGDNEETEEATKQKK